MRIVFMGTPDFAVPSLEGLISAGHEVCGVFSQPDKPVGRHQNKLQPTPVKSCAAAHGIPAYQASGWHSISPAQGAGTGAGGGGRLWPYPT